MHIGVYSVGGDIIHRPQTTDYIKGGLYELRDNTMRLRASKHANDIEAVRSINNNFLVYDHTLATRKLNHQLCEPIGKDILEWMTHAPSNDIEMFCRWSLMRTRQLTRALHRDQPDFINLTMDKAEDLVKHGLFPPLAVPVIDAATRRYQVQGMDSFFRGGKNAAGFCTDDIIAMANRYTSPKYLHGATGAMKKTMFHEYLHGAGRDRGFFWGISTRLPVARILEEAFVEHSSVVAFSKFLTKRPNVVDPAKRFGVWNHNSGYRQERTFLSTLLTHTEIPLEQMSEAYFRPRGDHRGEQLRDDIERKIGAFFGTRYIFFDFMKEYEMTVRKDRSDLLQRKITDLTKPSTL